MTMQRYQTLGVSAGKEEVHKAIENLDKGLFPMAFCKVLPDFTGKDDDYVNLIHADTAGTKTSLAYLYWKETQKMEIWKGIAQDALVMNLDDLACVGCLDRIIVSSTIGRNKHLIPGGVIENIVTGTQEFIQKMSEMNIAIHFGGGETADVGDIVRTVDVGITAFARMRKSDLLVNDIKPGNVIVGFASFGQTSYEEYYNSGIGSNGLTAARHDLLNKSYTKWSASYAPETPVESVYTGPFALTDNWGDGVNQYEIGQLLLSPTRTYLPIIQQILKLHKSSVYGIIHNTGGAQTKVKKFIGPVKVVKNNLFTVPPVFQLVKTHSLCSPQEMYQVYNMGHRLEMYVDESIAEEIIQISRSFNVDAQKIGYVEAHESPEVHLHVPEGHFIY